MPDPTDPDKGKLQGLVAAFTKRAVIVCGGRSTSESVTNNCFEYMPKNDRYKSNLSITTTMFDTFP